MSQNFKYYCKDYKNIDNYEMAAADNFKGWDCHHRLETHTPDGKRREVDITKKELIALGMYYHRPSEELIFLPRSEHDVYRKGKPKSEEHKKKMSEAKKDRYTGEKNPFYGRKHSEEAKEKMREVQKGKNIWTRGRHWFNNGKINKRAYECPPGFIPGRLRK